MSETAEQKQGWFARLKAGLSKSSGKIATGLSMLTGRTLDDALIEEIEELLITADLGPAPAAKLAAGLARERFDKTVTARNCARRWRAKSRRCWSRLRNRLPSTRRAIPMWC